MEEEEEEEWSLKLELLSSREPKQKRKRRISSSTTPVVEEKEKRVMVEKIVPKPREVINNKVVEIAGHRVTPSSGAQFKRRAQKVEEELLRSFLDGVGPDQEDVKMLRLALAELQRLGDALVADVVWSHYPSDIQTSRCCLLLLFVVIVCCLLLLFVVVVCCYCCLLFSLSP